MASHAPLKPPGLERDVSSLATSHSSPPALSTDGPVPALYPVASLVPSAPIPTIHALQRDDLLKPAYNWMSQQSRTSSNARVAYLHDVMANGNMPKTAQHAAMREFVAICKSVHDARTKA
jgi:hypothetical protein